MALHSYSLLSNCNLIQLRAWRQEAHKSCMLTDAKSDWKT